MQRLRVKVFGGFEARVGGGPALRLPTRKTQALLAYLAAHLGRPQSRDALAALLWGTSTDQQARQSLRQALYWVRRAVADAGGPAEVFAEGDGVALEPAAAEVDAASFETLVADGGGEALDSAIMLYRGDFLAGLQPEEPAFEDWLRSERARLRELAVDLLGRRVAQHEQAGAHEAAIQCAGRLLALDPLQESAHRTLMRLYTRIGRRPAALRQYQICADTFRRELGTDPEPETRALYQELLRKAGDDAPERGSARRLAANAPFMPLVGRRAELARLHEAMQAARAGRFGAVALLGEAGVGKTRLLGELVGEAAAARLLVGHAYEMEQDLPFAPVIDALRSGLGRSDGRIDAAIGDIEPSLREHLHRLLPELWQSGARPAVEDRPQALFEAIAQWLERLAAEAPLLIVIEDAHWADDATVRLLSFLAHRLEALPLLLVLSAREEEVAEDGALGRLLRELGLRRQLATVKLARLSSTATSALVRVLGKQVARSTLARLAQRVWRQSAGNPFMIVELMHAALEAGSQRARAGSLPERVQALIAGRLDRLSEDGRRMVEIVAVIGGAFEFDLVQRASALAPAAAAEALDELVRRRILLTGEGGLTFSHDQIRAVAYARLLPARRQVLHRAVAEAIEASRAAEVDDRLAYHFARAGDFDRATACLVRAAGTARHRYAIDVTLKLLDEALANVQASGSAERDRRYLDVMLRKAQILSIFGRFKEVFDLLLPYRTRLEALQDPALEGPYCARLALTFAQVGSHRQAEAEARRAVACATRCGDDGVRGHAYYVLGVSGYFSGGTREGVARSSDGAGLLEQTGQRGAAGLAYWILALNHQLRGEFPAALTAAHRAGAIAEALGELQLASRAEWTIALVEVTRGNAAAAIAAADRALDLAGNHPANRSTALGIRGRALLARGELDAAARDLEQAVNGLSPFDIARAIATMTLAELRLAQGDVAAARTLAASARELATARECPWALAHARRCHAAVARAADAFDEAKIELIAALEVFDAQEARFESAHTRLYLAALLQSLGDRVTAKARATEALRLLEQLDAPHYLAQARTLGNLARTAEAAR
jgi:DNA-binding SARP family transcriptional activator